jgi:GNAT superfamily N-acetyltransferase
VSGPNGLTIRAVTGDADLQVLAGIVNTTTPEDPTTLDEIHWSDATYPGSTRLIAELDGRAVGAATVGRIYMYPSEYPALWGFVGVLPEARRQGIGERLLRGISDAARAAGKSGLHMACMEDRPAGIEFLAHRGFTELERSKSAKLDLAGLPVPLVTAPPGIEFTTLAARPDLVQGVHAVALEAFDDIPGADDPMAVGDLAEFRARDIDRAPIPKEAFFVAVDRASGRAVGYASLMMLAGSTTRAYHDMTAVLRTFRGRGIASALKEATIAWAIEHELAVLETGNDEANAPMRAVNARLGYRPLPDEITMRGPLFDGMMTR